MVRESTPIGRGRHFGLLLQGRTPSDKSTCLQSPVAVAVFSVRKMRYAQKRTEHKSRLFHRIRYQVCMEDQPVKACFGQDRAVIPLMPTILSYFSTIIAAVILSMNELTGIFLRVHSLCSPFIFGIKGNAANKPSGRRKSKFLTVSGSGADNNYHNLWSITFL